MRRLLLLLCLVLTVPGAASAGVCDDWNALYQKIRDYRIEPEQAQREFAVLHRRLRAAYPNVGGKARYYPVAGYDASGGEKGRNYKPRGYKFFTGNPRGIHAAHDLFIRDKDQDCLDDRSGEPVEVVAYAGGVVVGLNPDWSYPSELRGGKYLWIFDSRSGRYDYYAHLNHLDVRLGQVVKAGEHLGMLGRTGKNAWMQRSPTHLHFMALSYDGGRMTPWNPWPALLKARLVSAPAPVAALPAR